IDVAFFQILPRRFSGLLVQDILVKPSGGFRMKFEQRATGFMLSIFVFASALRDDWNANSGRQFSHRRREVDVFVFHDEPKSASADTAAKTVKRLPLRTNVKRRRFFLMKRTEGLKIRSRPF